MRASLVLVAAALVLGATACGERSEPTGPSVRLYPVTVERTGTPPIVLGSAPRRVAAVTRSAVSIVTTLESGQADRPAVLRQTGNVAVDDLRRFHPDLIVASEDADTGALERAARATKAPVYTLQQGSIREVERGISDLGLLLGRQLPARQVIGHITSLRRSVSEHVHGLAHVRVFVDTGFFITVPSNSLVGDLVREAGGRSVAGADPGPGPFDLGLLRRLDPSFYLATSDSGTSLKALRRNPRTRSLQAVRAGHFGIVKASSVEPGPAIGDGLAAIARLLHPNAFR